MALPENEKKSEKKEKPLTKVIIRRLPPSIDQETFLNQVSPIPDYNYIYMVKGDLNLGEFAFSRVYINFVNSEDIYNFKERFDNYVFLDSKGHEYPAVVEFASFQKIPKKRGKPRMDPKCGTIESDPIYLDFVESLSKPQEQDEKPEYTLQLSSEHKNEVTTPLLEYIKNKRAQRMRIREVRREERKRREFDRKKDRYDDRKKPGDEKSPIKSVVVKSQTSRSGGSKEEKSEGGVNENKIENKSNKIDKGYEKPSSYYNSKERKYDDRKYEDRKHDDRKYDDRKYDDRKYDDRRKDIKPRYPRKEYPDNRDYKRSEDYKDKDYRSKYDDNKKEADTKTFPKKVKKYSERREERKIEAQKAEQRKLEHMVQENKVDEEEKTGENKEKKLEEIPDVSSKVKPTDKELTSKENESQMQKRIRNKDRPTIAIYRPGMLSKRKQNDDEPPESKDGKADGKN